MVGLGSGVAVLGCRWVVGLESGVAVSVPVLGVSDRVSVADPCGCRLGGCFGGSLRVCRWWSLVLLDRCVLCWVTLGVRFGGDFFVLLFTF